MSIPGSANRLLTNGESPEQVGFDRIETLMTKANKIAPSFLDHVATWIAGLKTPANCQENIVELFQTLQKW
ncbi:MAG: hypothetical protein D6698_03440 [Gammaproteobacteria bacterium]|nr:MAG: hypothetical protein D6698_03440 [Gammaproteobacteria bacterium]